MPHSCQLFITIDAEFSFSKGYVFILTVVGVGSVKRPFEQPYETPFKILVLISDHVFTGLVIGNISVGRFKLGSIYRTKFRSNAYLEVR